MMTDTSRTALLVMDFQQSIVERLGSPSVLASANVAIAAARARSIMVLYIRVAFRPGYAEISSRNAMFSALASGPNDYSEVSASTQIHTAVAPSPDEHVLVKRRVSAFAGSDLDVILRAREIDTLVLAGLATSGVVLSTVRYAADQDFGLVVLSDACADGDPEVHRVLMEKVFPGQAKVLTAAQWVSTLEVE
jgi:nicotinamidase-related amidase